MKVLAIFIQMIWSHFCRRNLKISEREQKGDQKSSKNHYNLTTQNWNCTYILIFVSLTNWMLSKFQTKDHTNYDCLTIKHGGRGGLPFLEYAWMTSRKQYLIRDPHTKWTRLLHYQTQCHTSTLRELNLSVLYISV